MAVSKVEGQELKKLIKMGKRREMNFAYVPGDKDDQTLMVDRRLKPGMLGKAAKKETGASKFSFGTFVVQGKEMRLTCERVVPTMARRLKKYLKTQKIPLNVVILDENGNEIENDIEDLPDDPELDQPDPEDGDQDTASAQEAQAQPDPDAAPESGGAAELAARLKQVKPALAAAQGEVAGKLKKALAAAVSQIKSGDLAAAERTVAALEAAAQKLSARQAAAPQQAPEPPAQDTGQQQALADRAEALRQAVASAPEAAAKKLGAALAAADKLVAEGKLAVAAATLDKIEQAAARVAAAQQAAPAADSTPIVQSRQDWNRTRLGLQQEMDALKSEIEAATRDVPGLDSVPQRTRVLFDQLAQLDDTLETALDALAGASDEAQRDALRAQASAIVGTYRSVLDTPFFKAVDDNGFTQTNIRGAALAALQQVSDSLAA